MLTSTINSIFIYGLLLSIALPIIGIYYISRKQAFIMDIAGHAYFGVYLLIKVLFTPLTILSSFIIAYLLARANNKSKVHESQANIMFIYLFFTILMLFIVNVFKPEALDTLVFGNIFSATWLNLLVLLAESIIFFFISYRFLNVLLLDVISNEMAKGVFGKNNVENKLLFYLFTSFLVLFHAINYFGILLTAAIAILPYFTIMQFKKGLKFSVFTTLVLSMIEYLLAFYISWKVDISLAVSYGIVALIPLILTKIYRLLKFH